MKTVRCMLPSAIFLLITGIVLLFIGDPLKRFIIKTQFVLTERSYLFDYWKESFPLHQEFYLFNWTNPGEIYNPDIKPKFQQAGPYEYDFVLKKENITWNSNGTITFRESRFWYYKKGTISDRITMIDSVALMTAHLSRNINPFLRAGLSWSVMALKSALSVTKTARELLFEGYSDPLITAGSKIPFLSQKIPVDKIGLFYKTNGTIGKNGVFNYGIGTNTEFAKLYKWNYKNEVPSYPDQCKNIFESVGDFYPYPVSKTSIKLFLGDLCRVFTLQYVGEEMVDGLLGYKFSILDYNFDNGTKYPENKCYCNGECVPSGLFNTSACQMGAPLFTSLPHFRHADPYYTNHIDGLEPTDYHDFSVVVEPETGFPLRVNATLQGNFLVQPVSIRHFKNIPRRYFIPIFWSKSVMEVPFILLLGFKIVLKMPKIATYTGLTLIMISFIFIVPILVNNCKKFVQTKKKIEKKEAAVLLQKGKLVTEELASLNCR